MAISVRIKDVDFIRHLSVRGASLDQMGQVQEGFGGTVHQVDGEQLTGQATMEVYTGWVTPRFVAGGSTDRVEVRTFLPIGANRILEYPEESSILGATATASPATIGPAEDEAVIFGVDGVVSVGLERQQNVGGISGEPFMLVMRVQLVGLNVTFHRFTYQVTILTRPNAEIAEHSIDGLERPD
jgi:hypothetical protein